MSDRRHGTKARTLKTSRHLGIATAIAALALFALPSAASATVSCSLSGSTLDIDDVDAGTQRTVFRISHEGGAFLHTPSTEAPGDDEIEISLDGAGGSTDNFSPIGTAGSEKWRFGNTATGHAANFNIDEAAASIDADDVTMTNVETIQAITMLGGNDTLDARGSDSGAEPQFTGPMSLTGTKQLVTAGGTDHIFGGTGDNWRLEGIDGDDEMVGNAGNDSLHLEGTGDDSADGNGGTDTCTYLNHNLPITVDLRETGPQATGGAGTDTLTDCENLGGGDEDDVLIGDGGPNRLDGGENSMGEMGADVLLGLGGDDNMTGSLGVDTVSYAQGSSGAITVSLALVTAQNTNGAGTDTLLDGSPADGIPDTENLTGSEFGDTLTGNTQANAIDGGPGADTIALASGADDFDAYDGANDVVSCGADSDADTGEADNVGADTINADCDANDQIDFAPQTLAGAVPADGATINDPTPTYSLSSDEAGVVAFEWSTDAGANYFSCSATCTLDQLADGTHTVLFRARDNDENLNLDPTPLSRTVTIDTVAPGSPQLDSITPAGPANRNALRLRGTAAEGTVNVYANASCAGAPVASGSIGQFGGLGIAVTVADNTTTTFATAAVDGGGNLSGCSNARTYVEDSRAPETRIAKRPKNLLTRPRARFRFAADEAGARFQCKLDRRKYRPCGARKTYRGLRPGPHRLKVRALDRAGNLEKTPAKDRFRVEL